MNEADPGLRMLGLLIRDFVIHFKEGSLKQLGLTHINDFRFGIYGLGLWPVFSIYVHDQTTFTKWIVRSAKKAGATVRQHSKSLLITTQFDPSFKSSLAISFIESHWVNFALVPDIFSQKMLPYLNGKQAPTSSTVSSHQLSKWASESKGTIHNISYIGFQRILKTLLGLGEGLNQAFPWIDDSITKEISPPCIDAYLEMSSSVPYLITGQEKDQKNKTYTLRALLKFSESLAKVTQTFMPKYM